MLKQSVTPTRRFSSRIATPEGVWVCWQCEGREDISPVLNVSLGGLFIVTAHLQPVDSTAAFDFLVQEGQIRAEAVVRHVEKGRGLGLKFTAIQDEDRSHLAELVARLHGYPGSRAKL